MTINQSLIEEALQHAANVFSSFINKEVKLEIVSTKHENEKTENQNDPIIVLLSELKGALKGKSYLKIKPLDAQNLFLVCLPEPYKDQEEMQNAILLELDNILTAAVVTVFSNHLAIKTHAHVPQLMSIQSYQLDEMIDSDQKNNHLIFYFNTKFNIQQHSILSEFIWVMDFNTNQ